MQLRKHLANIVVIVVIIVVLVAAALFVFQAGASGSSGWAIVHDSDGQQTRIDLSGDETVMVTTSLGYNVVQVADGRARVIEADCPNHDCIDQGEISAPGEKVVCLPHQLWVEIAAQDAVQADSGLGTDSDVDTLAR